MPLSPLEGDGVRIDPAIIGEAAEWLVRLRVDDSDRQQQACMAWRQARPEHDQAWQRVAMLAQDLRATAAYSTPKLAARALNTVAARQSRRAAMKWALGIGGVGVIAWTSADQMPWQAWSAEYRTAPGEQRTVVLEDGTRIVLNTDSAVDVRFDDVQRNVILRSGEIQITTGKDARQRPFRVVTGEGAIRPIGTRFIVRERAAPTRDILVSVIEGAVEIRPRLSPDQRQILRAGEQASFTSTRAGSPEPAPSLAGAWVNGMLIASRMRLDEFVVELGRYRRGVLRCDPAIAAQLVTGAFPVADTDRVLAMLEEVLPVRVAYHTRYWVTVSAR
jgi:transmembrane sensor